MWIAQELAQQILDKFGLDVSQLRNKKLSDIKSVSIAGKEWK